jgi:hypothetical protein
MNSVISFDRLIDTYPNRSWHFEAKRFRLRVVFVVRHQYSNAPDRSLCLPDAVNGHAAAPSPAMKSRRRILDPLRTFIFSLSRTGSQNPKVRQCRGPEVAIRGSQHSPIKDARQITARRHAMRLSRCISRARRARLGPPHAAVVKRQGGERWGKGWLPTVGGQPFPFSRRNCRRKPLKNGKTRPPTEEWPMGIFPCADLGRMQGCQIETEASGQNYTVFVKRGESVPLPAFDSWRLARVSPSCSADQILMNIIGRLLICWSRLKRAGCFGREIRDGSPATPVSAPR